MKATLTDVFPPLCRKFCVSLAGVLSLAALCSCATTKVEVQQERAELLIKEPMLLIVPLANSSYMDKTCETLGTYFKGEVPKRVKGKVVYSSDIPGLKTLATWDNLIKNGELNANEVATMAKTIGCASALSIQVLDYQSYPPFRMIVQLLWVDAETGNVIGRLYNDVDISDSQVNYRYRSFSGQGPVKELYEEFAYSEDLYHTSYLMPERFKLFVAAFSATIMFQEVGAVPWWYFWRTI